MAGNDHHPDGRNGSTQASNVVHLRPRQWLESEDELVPIGGAKTESSADAASAGHASPDSEALDKPGHASTWLGAGAETVPIAPEPGPQASTARDIGDSTASWAASDFWGEDAANVHDALEGPVPAAPPDEVPPPARRRTASPRRLLRAPALAAITIAAAAVLAAAINGFGSAPAPHRQLAPTASLHASASARSTPGAVAPAVTRAAAARLRMTAATTRHHSGQRAHLRAHPHAMSQHVGTRREHRGTGVRAARVVVRYVATPPVSTPAATTYSTNAPTQASSASSPSPAGPTGTASFIGPGTSPSG